MKRDGNVPIRINEIDILLKLLFETLYRKKHPIGLYAINNKVNAQAACDKCVELFCYVEKQKNSQDIIHYLNGIVQYGFCCSSEDNEVPHADVFNEYTILSVHEIYDWFLEAQRSGFYEMGPFLEFLTFSGKNFIGYDFKDGTIKEYDIETGKKVPIFRSISSFLKALIRFYIGNIYKLENNMTLCITDYNLFTKVCWEVNGLYFYLNYVQVKSYREYLYKVLEVKEEAISLIDYMMTDEMFEFLIDNKFWEKELLILYVLQMLKYKICSSCIKKVYDKYICYIYKTIKLKSLKEIISDYFGEFMSNSS